ncbi:MAG: methyltransferase [Cyclobacteriaceae bacterium]|nr:methyltransferase [Cyclobacteriaceae bacterium]
MLLAFSLLQLTNGILIIFFLFLVFRFIETNWSYKISKPYQWEEAVRSGVVSKKLKKIERFYRDKVRFYTFWLQINRLKKESVVGALAEVGVYKGETARIIHEIDNTRPLHLFDTFEGFNKQDLEIENSNHTNYSIDFSDTEIELVSKFIKGNDNILFHKGYFPVTAENLRQEIFAFVHLDADLYKPTLAGLEFFYPRLSPGGVIIVHDYNHNWQGVTNAVDEFVKTIPENLMEISDWQGSIMIIKNK